MKSKMNNVLKAFALGLILFATACGTGKKDDAVDQAEDINETRLEDADKDVQKDADFIVEAVAGSKAEIQMAQVALDRSSNAEAKTLANMIVQDHTALLNNLTGYANKNGIAVPTEESADAKDNIVKLREADAKDFDKKWCEMLQDKHENSIDKFEKRADKTEDMELANLINNAVPILKTHLSTLEAHEEKMK